MAHTWTATQLDGWHPSWRFVPDRYMSDYDQDGRDAISWFDMWVAQRSHWFWAPSLSPEGLP